MLSQVRIIIKIKYLLLNYWEYFWGKILSKNSFNIAEKFG